MWVFDIILGIPLIYAAYSGFRDGIVVQLGGIAGLIIGIYLAFRYGDALGMWLGFDESFSAVGGFLLMIIAVLIAIAILGRITKGLFKFAGLGLFDSVGGLVLGIAKMALMLSVLLIIFEAINQRKHWASQKTIDSSVLYNPIREVSTLAFPYIDFVKTKITEI